MTTFFFDGAVSRKNVFERSVIRFVTLAAWAVSSASTTACTVGAADFWCLSFGRPGKESPVSLPLGAPGRESQIAL